MALHKVMRKRVRHHDIPGVAHNLTFSCFKRRPFLSRDQTREYLAEAIEKAHSRHAFDVWANVIMPEHAHLLVFPSDTVQVSSLLHAVKQSVARRALLHVRRHEPEKLPLFATGQRHTPYRFWLDGSGYDSDVCDSRALRLVVEYIHGNPVRRGLVQYAEKWKRSSAAEWMGLGQGPVTLNLEAFPH